MRKADNLPPSCAVVTKYGNLNFLEPSGPLRACNGTALPLPLLNIIIVFDQLHCDFLSSNTFLMSRTDETVNLQAKDLSSFLGS